MNQLKTLPQQIAASPLIGPTAIAATLCALFLRGSPMQITPIIALFGIGLCLQWRLQGLITAFILLTGSIAYELISMTQTEIFWNTGTALSFALALTIITLHQLDKNEQQELVANPKETQSKSCDHEPRITSLEEEKQNLERELTIVKKEYQTALNELKLEQQSRINAKEEHEQKEASLTKQNLNSLRQLELFKQEHQQTQLKAEEERKSHSTLLKQSQDSLRQLEIAKKEHQAALSFLQNEQQKAQTLNQQHQNNIDSLKELNQQYARQLEQAKKETEKALNQLQNEQQKAIFAKEQHEQELTLIKNSHQQAMEELLKLKKEKEKEKLEERQIDEGADLLQEFKKVDRALRIAKGQIKELRAQFTEKSNLLDETRKQLFQAEEQLLLQKRGSEEFAIDLHPEFKHLNAQLKEMEKEFAIAEKNYKEEIESLNDLITNLMREHAQPRSRP